MKRDKAWAIKGTKTNIDLWKSYIGSGEDEYAKGRLAGAKEMLDILEQLDEPELPVIPQFVADWYKDNRYNLENSIFQLCIDSNKGDLEGEFKYWFTNNSHAIETLIQMQHGYSVEREPKWVIKCPEGYVQSIDISNTYTNGASAKDYTRTGITPIKDSAIRFTDKSKAQVMATFVGEGEVKEWTE